MPECSYLAQARATSAAAAFSFCFPVMEWPEADVSSNQEQSRVSKPFRQSAGSFVRLRGWQSLRQLRSTSAVMLQREGSVLLCDWISGNTNKRPMREVNGACSGCCSKPCRLSKDMVSSSLEFSRSCCSSSANCRCAFHSPLSALRRYSSSRA